ncbi:MAG: RluA family pseudouridine synthase, partial [Rhizobiaceae bacterium]
MATADSEVQGTRKVATAQADAAGRRLDQWLAAVFAGDLSRSRLQSLIREGSLRLNGDPVRDPGRKVRAGDLAEIEMLDAAPARPAGEAIPLAILREDDDVVVIDKPAGLVVHPGAGNGDGTLVNALIHHCGDSLSGIGGVRRPGIVHRLDKETSGVMVVAKNDRSHRALSTLFAEHGRDGKLERAYLALVWGVPPARQGVIDAPLGR